MRRAFAVASNVALLLFTLCSLSFLFPRAVCLYAKEKTPAFGPDDPTFRLFQMLDASYGGKLADFYIIADIYKDPGNPNEELQRVLRVEYDKNRGFGKLNLYIRSVGKMGPEQLKAYTPKMIYEYGVSDLEKFVKTEPGPFGKPGDVYLRASDSGPLASSPINDDRRKAYEHFLTEHLLPALHKK